MLISHFHLDTVEVAIYANNFILQMIPVPSSYEVLTFSQVSNLQTSNSKLLIQIPDKAQYLLAPGMLYSRCYKVRWKLFPTFAHRV